MRGGGDVRRMQGRTGGWEEPGKARGARGKGTGKKRLRFWAK
jgi:hypothetical protein